MKSGEVLNPFLQRPLDWGLTGEKNLFSSMDCVFRNIKIIRSPLSCNNQNWVLRPYLKASLNWGLMEEKNLFSSMDCVLLHLHSCCSDAELLLDCCSAPSRKCPIEYSELLGFKPNITDGVHRNDNFVEIIPVFSTFSKKKKKL